MFARRCAVYYSQQVLSYVCKTLLYPAYSVQVSQFLIPAMAYGKYPFPFVDLITTLITGSKEQGAGKNKGSGQSSTEKPAPIEKTAWLLGAFVIWKLRLKNLNLVKIVFNFF
ncbi:hypothetical protein DPMN_105374 [Dreissena polymorpha]|uniref:Uncharacterized protein n=1 Tax=Dreissena polymorpha TaxID=45954 RepID=A0A9D4HGQ3_DREPO|nr:hypothetical protein DPMN_105374 [Dreissena polymorpha]